MVSIVDTTFLQIFDTCEVRETHFEIGVHVLAAAIYEYLSFRWVAVNWLTGCGSSWWRHQMETFSALLAFCAGNSPVTGEFPTQRPVTRSFDVTFDLRPNKPLSKQSWGWWFETLSCSLWRHCNVFCRPVTGVGWHALFIILHMYGGYMHGNIRTCLRALATG